VGEASATDPHAVLRIAAYFETRRVQELSPGQYFGFLFSVETSRCVQL